MKNNKNATRKYRPESAPRGRNITVKEENTLLPFLFETLKEQSRTAVKQLLGRGQILVNETVTTQFDTALKPGDVVTISYVRRKVPFNNQLLNIVYEDDFVIVVNKRIKKLNRIADELDEGYLLGETLLEPYGATEREYFFVMKRISHSAIARIEELRRSGEEYSDYIEKWIHEIKTPLTSCALIIANGGDRAKLMAEFKKADNLAFFNFKTDIINYRSVSVYFDKVFCNYLHIPFRIYLIYKMNIDTLFKKNSTKIKQKQKKYQIKISFIKENSRKQILLTSSFED